MIADLARRLAENSNIRRLSRSAFVRFTIVGIITTVLDIVLFGGLTLVAEMNPVAANVGSYSCGIGVSFIFNRIWTFDRLRAGTPVGHEALKFAATHAAGLTLSTVIVSLLALVFPPLFAKAVSVPVVFIWNYVLARYWVFR